MAYLLVILALVLLVVVHELGHFLAARAVGVRSTKFYVFFPPALLKKQVGEVEYGIGAIPAGGFVKLPGMFEPVPSEVADRVRWDIDRVGIEDERLEAAVDRVAAARTPDELPDALRALDEELVAVSREERVAQAVPEADRPAARKRIARLRKQVADTIDDCHPRAYWRASLWRRMTVIFAGPLVNIIVAFIALAGFFWLHQPTYQIGGPLHVDKVEAGSAAEGAGLTKDSVITYWNGPIEGAEPAEFIERVRDSRGKPVRLAWTDEGRDHVATVFPKQAEDGRRIGVILPLRADTKEALVIRRGEHVRTSFGEGARLAGIEMRDITWGNLTRLPQVFFRSEVRDDVSSVVGIVQVAEDVDRAGMFWRYVGVISLVLAVMNLLPLLPLDGGHLFFGLLEFLRRGRPMPRASFERASAIGFSLVLVLFFIGLSNDLGH